jgi:hypothetical protein
MSAGTAHRPELALLYRDTAEFERRFAGAGGAGAKAA